MNGQNTSEPISWDQWVKQLMSQPKEEQLKTLVAKVKEQRQQIQKESSEKSELLQSVQELQSQLQNVSDQLLEQTENRELLEAIHNQKEEFDRRSEALTRKEKRIKLAKIEIREKQREYKDFKELVKELKKERAMQQLLILIEIVGTVIAFSLLFILFG